MRTRVSKAFTLVEILIVVVILGILAAIVIPQFTSASQEAQVGNVVTQLQTLRSQIELYKLQHRDELPDFRRHGWNPLTSETAEDGTITSRGPIGPYLQAPPKNPLNGNTRLLIVRGAPGRDFKYDKNDAGFIYDEQSGRIWGLDATGRLFTESGGGSAQAWSE